MYRFTDRARFSLLLAVPLIVATLPGHALAVTEPTITTIAGGVGGPGAATGISLGPSCGLTFAQGVLYTASGQSQSVIRARRNAGVRWRPRPGHPGQAVERGGDRDRSRSPHPGTRLLPDSRARRIGDNDRRPRATPWAFGTLVLSSRSTSRTRAGSGAAEPGRSRGCACNGSRSRSGRR